MEKLANILSENQISTGLDIDLLIELSDYAVEGRYTFFNEVIEDIKKHINMLINALKDLYS